VEIDWPLSTGQTSFANLLIESSMRFCTMSPKSKFTIRCISPEECDVKSGLFPLQIDARSLPFAHNYFDTIICIDSIHYFEINDLYSSYFACFLKPGGLIGMAGAGLTQEITDNPPHLRDWWIPEIWYHTANWRSDH